MAELSKEVKKRGKMKRTLTGRQGDVYFVADKIPEGATPIKTRPFALGEVTGHSHQVCVEDIAKVQMFEMPSENGVRTFMRVSAEGGVSIQHEDHDPIGTVSKLPAGWEGEVTIAKEYTPEGIRSVLD